MVEKIRRMGRKRRTKSRVEMTVEGEGRREDNKKKREEKENEGRRMNSRTEKKINGREERTMGCE